MPDGNSSLKAEAVRDQNRWFSEVFADVLSEDSNQ